MQFILFTIYSYLSKFGYRKIIYILYESYPHLGDNDNKVFNIMKSYIVIILYNILYIYIYIYIYI